MLIFLCPHYNSYSTSFSTFVAFFTNFIEMANIDDDLVPVVVMQARALWQERLDTASQAREISVKAQLDRFSKLEWDLFATSEEMHVDMTDIYGKLPGAGPPNVNVLLQSQKIPTPSEKCNKYLLMSMLCKHISLPPLLPAGESCGLEPRFSKAANSLSSICAPNSVLPLKITPDALWQIMMVHELPPSFLDLVVSFATNGQEAEAGPGALTMTRRPDGSYG